MFSVVMTWIPSARMSWTSWYRLGVRLPRPHDAAAPLVLEAVPFQEHLVRLPDAGAVPEVDLQPAAPRAADQSDEGVGPVFRHTGYILPSSERFSVRTFTLGSPSNPRVLPSVCAPTFARTSFSPMPRAFATRADCSKAFRTLMWGPSR